MQLRPLTLDLHDRWAEPPSDLKDLVRYLTTGVVLRRVRSHTIDAVVPVRGRVVPGSVLTDGVWLWPAGHAHYVGTYAVRLPEDFVTHVRVAGHRVVPLDPYAVREAAAAARALGAW